MGGRLARIRSLTRRAGSFTPDRLTCGDVTLDAAEQELSAKSAVRLSSREAKLMRLFLLNAGKALTAEEILGRVWKDEPEADAAVAAMYVAYLREKIEAVQSRAVILGGEAGPYTLEAR